MNHESNNNTNCDWCVWYTNKRIIKWTGGRGSWRRIEDHPNYSIIENGQNTEKSPEELLSLKLQSKASAKTEVKNSPVNNYKYGT